MAVAAGLVAMVARFSPAQLDGAEQVAGEADELRSRVLTLAVDDGVAYRGVLDAFSVPRTEDDAARQARWERITTALTQAVSVPLAVAEAGAQVAEMAAAVAQDGNVNLRGDAITGALLAHAAVRSAAALARLNVELGRLDPTPIEHAATLERAADDAVRRALAEAQ